MAEQRQADRIQDALDEAECPGEIILEEQDWKWLNSVVEAYPLGLV